MFASSLTRAALGLACQLAPGSITDLPSARSSVTPLESAAHLVVVRFGTRIGL